MTGDSIEMWYERSVLKRLSRSQAWMRRGSKLYETHDCVNNTSSGTLHTPFVSNLSLFAND